MRRTLESSADRLALVQEAGLGKLSMVSVLAGMLVAYGAFAVLAAVAAGVLGALGVDTSDLAANDWRRLGVAGGIVSAVVLLLSYLFGGYVAGRMARRAGAANGAAVFVLGVLVAGAVGAAVGTQTGSDAIVGNLRSIGVPTSGSEYGALGTVAGIGSLLAMLLGSLLGGIAGERWHGKLVARALDPTVGPEAAAAEDAAEAERRRAAMADRRRRRAVDLDLADQARGPQEPEPGHAEGTDADAGRSGGLESRTGGVARREPGVAGDGSRHARPWSPGSAR